jgi:hypothetical protein
MRGRRSRAGRPGEVGGQRARLHPGRRRALAALLGLPLLAGCGLPERIGCLFVDLPAGLAAASAAERGAAAECAMHADPDALVPLVPALVPLLTDQAVIRRYASGGGLIGFGEAGPRTVIVAMPALRAVERATPARENIAPLVDGLVAAANRTRPQGRGSALHGEPESAALNLIGILSTAYHRAGLRDEVASAVRSRVAGIRNAAFWADADFNREVSDLYDGRTPYPWDGSLLPQARPESRAPPGVLPATASPPPPP